MLRRFGAVGVAAVGCAGTTTARERPPLDVPQRVDVEGLGGEVPLTAVVDDDRLPSLPGGIDPAAVSVEVDADAETVEGVQWCCNSSCGTDCAICVPCDEILDPIA